MISYTGTTIKLDTEHFIVVYDENTKPHKDNNTMHHWANRETAQQRCRLGLTSDSEVSATHSSLRRVVLQRNDPHSFCKSAVAGRLSLWCFSVTAMHANSTKRQPERFKPRMDCDSKTASPWCAFPRPAVLASVQHTRLRVNRGIGIVAFLPFASLSLFLFHLLEAVREGVFRKVSLTLGSDLIGCTLNCLRR